MSDGVPPARPASYDKKVALVLQGGGALGSYQAGVYEALASSQYVPDWVAGISIGAVNAAIIAGMLPKTAWRGCAVFWEEVTSRSSMRPLAFGGPFAEGERRLSSLAALMFGQRGFFAPRSMLDWISFPNLISYYDTASLKSTLELLGTDDDRIVVEKGEIAGAHIHRAYAETHGFGIDAIEVDQALECALERGSIVVTD